MMASRRQVLAGSAAVIGAAVVAPAVAIAQHIAPEPFLECNGQAVSRKVYTRLFAAIGETFGRGDGIETFRLPDFSAYGAPAGGYRFRLVMLTGEHEGQRVAGSIAHHLIRV